MLLFRFFYLTTISLALSIFLIDYFLIWCLTLLCLWCDWHRRMFLLFIEEKITVAFKYAVQEKYFYFTTYQPLSSRTKQISQVFPLDVVNLLALRKWNISQVWHMGMDPHNRPLQNHSPEGGSSKLLVWVHLDKFLA